MNFHGVYKLFRLAMGYSKEACGSGRLGCGTSFGDGLMVNDE